MVLDLLDPSAVPALYRRAANIGHKWASIDGFATILEHKDEVRATMKFCLANDPTYWYQGPDRYFWRLLCPPHSRLLRGRRHEIRRALQPRSLEAEPEYIEHTHLDGGGGGSQRR